MASINTQPGTQRNVNETGTDASAKCTSYRLRDFNAAPTESVLSWPTCLASACFCAITLGKTAVPSMLFRYVSLFLRFSSLFELELGPWRHHRELEIYTKIDVCTAPAPTKAEPLVPTLTYAQSVSLLLLLILCYGMEGFHKQLSFRLIYVN